MRAVASLVLLLVGCDGSATTLDPGLRLRLLDGDGQEAPVSSALPAPLRVEVSDRVTGAPEPGVTVRWQVEDGNGAALAPVVSVTGADGTAATRVTLGSSPGPVRVQATVAGIDGLVTFGANARDRLTLTGVPAGPVRAGDMVALEGQGLIGGVARFSGVPAPVVAGPGGQAQGEVPSCLPTGFVEVSVVASGAESATHELQVQQAGSPVSLAVGEDLHLLPDPLLRCRLLRYEPGAEYLLVVQNRDVVGGRSTDYQVRSVGPEGSSGAGILQAAARGSPASPAPGRLPQPGHGRVGLAEGTAVPVSGPVGFFPGQVGRARAGTSPQVGDTALFPVFAGFGAVDTVVADARYAGSRVVLFVDRRTPAGAVDASTWMAMGQELDEHIVPAVSATFGAASDLDGNERVVILFTPTVNGLTPRGAGALIAGFFYPPDLDPTRPGGREILYAAVPDPQGQFSDPVPVDLLIPALPAVLAHEFQHLVHHAVRVLAGLSNAQEAVWLSEALAQMAEDVLYEHHRDLGDLATAAAYRAGNLERARRFLTDPAGVSLTLASTEAGLALRGAGWLFARYVTDHFGGSAALRGLTASSVLGTETVVGVTGEPWARTFSDWSVALALDDTGVGPARFRFPSLSVEQDILPGGAANVELPMSSGSFSRLGTLAASAAAYITITGTGVDAALTLTDPDGLFVAGEDPPALRVVRIR